MKPSSLLRLLSVAFALVTVTVSVTAQAATQQPDPVSELRGIIEARLLLMPEVAKYKWNHKLPVEDLTRESDLLDAMIAKAEKEGLSHGYAITLISAQVEAAKAIQNRLVDHWRFSGEGKLAGERDLKTDLRPKISDLTSKLVATAKAAAPMLSSCAAQEELRNPPDSMDDDLMAWRIAADGIIDSKPCQ